MKILLRIGIFSLAVLFVGLIGLIIVNPSLPVNFTEQQAQTLLEEKLPITFPSKMLTEFTLHKGGTVDFLPDGTIQAHGSYKVKPTLTKESHFEGIVTITGRPVYRDKAFYIEDAVISDVSGTLILSERAQAASRMLGKLKDTFLKSTDIDPADAAKILNLEEIRKNLPESLAQRVSQLPIYKLDGKKWWHFFASSSLQELQVDDTQVTATIGLGKVALTIVLIFIGVSIAALLAVGLMMSGGDGLGVFLLGGLLS